MSTKRDTILWIEHAISYFKTQGKTQKEMSKFLDLSESRISEMKVGKRALTTSERQRIIDICGSPRRNSGRYERAYYFESLDRFFDVYGEFIESRYHNNLLTQLRSKEVQSKLLASFDIFENGKFNDKGYIELSDIDKLIRSNEADEVFERYSSWLREEDGARQPKMEFMDSDVVLDDKKAFHLLYQLWFFVQSETSFYLCNEEPHNIAQLSHCEDIIMTGEKVLLMSNEGELRPVNEPVLDKFGSLNRYPDSLKPEIWQAVRVEFYLSEEMNYHIFIQLSPKRNIFTYLDVEKYGDNAAYMDELFQIAEVDTEDLLIVIENLNASALWSSVENVRKWCALPSDSNYKLKQRIAKFGGYVPGARVLV
ncbi:hypothetical protein ACED56_15430 [Vibrio splendidus]|jgi:hypothetical protein|uniref:hypothetical protein n=1 Tax=Vibrio splendidus TaxID=29497 RepID=UPI000C84F3FA|nr:hypothetical protein [Vibrio splendidus]MDR9827318.1 hypothetical protein [Vibrio sp. FNV 38]MCQ8867683.1 hypothetical protein [Vibrio splendidus]MDH5896607.1 hypothetical protein [Vibrio splendidus]PMG24124.1 hypothetical protein BCU95_13710 [Vibrio splendidus]PMG62571.1 hypothetical protein BCU88_06475 [Vibrio splendidus]